MIGGVSAKACPALQLRCQEEGIQCQRFSAKKSRGKYVRYKFREISPDLGRTIQSYCHRRRESVLFRRSRREATSLTMECP